LEEHTSRDEGPAKIAIRSIVPGPELKLAPTVAGGLLVETKAVVGKALYTTD
jgi:hypothetical protein